MKIIEEKAETRNLTREELLAVCAYSAILNVKESKVGTTRARGIIESEFPDIAGMVLSFQWGASKYGTAHINQKIERDATHKEELAFRFLEFYNTCTNPRPEICDKCFIQSVCLNVRGEHRKAAERITKNLEVVQE